MELIRGIHNLRDRHQGCVATIGNFDGVHLGHQAIVEQLLAHARALSLPSLVIVFEPQPQEFFLKNKSPARLMRLRDKVRVLEGLGVDRVLCIHFNEYFRSLSAEAFIGQLLTDKLAMRYLVVGDDFRFGAGRVGDFTLLQAAGQKNGFIVEDTPTCEDSSQRVSSTRIRECLKAGDFEVAQQLLGRPYQVTGRVGYGQQLGRTIGAPTANISLQREASPLCGVYAVRAKLLDGSSEWLDGVANVGERPTVSGIGERLEVHLFNFDENLYGKKLCVQFYKSMREEKKFSGVAELTQAIQQDISAAKQYFAGLKFNKTI